MRIGPLQSLTFEKYDKIQQRAIVTKHIPQYIQTILYDLNYPNPSTLHIEGTLVGTSQSNLAVLIQQFRAVCRSRKVVWIDASDAYQGRLDLVRIFNVQGPTIDSNVGILTAKFILDAQILPPWGTTHANPWKAAGVYLRDLNNIGREYALNPLMNHCNFTINSSNPPYSFSWEFILDNQNAFTNATSVQEASCTSLGSGTASATNPIAVTGALNLPFDSITIDGTNYVEGLGDSLKATKNTPAASGAYNIGYDFGSSGIDISSYDRLRVWYRCDQAGQQNYWLQIIDTSNNYREWVFTLQGANIWQNVEVALATYTDQSVTAPNLASIRYINAVVEVLASPPASVNLWLDDIRVEIGYVNHCEDTSGWVVADGSGQTFSNDETILREGSASIVESGTTVGNSLGLTYHFPVSAWDLSVYDFVLFWWRSDFGGASVGALDFYVETTQATQFFHWHYSNLNANEWYRFVVPLKDPQSTYGSPSLSSIVTMQWSARNCVNSVTAKVWVDEVAVDFGNWIHLEMMIPDNVSQNQTPASVQVSSWDGSIYDVVAEEGAQGDGATISETGAHTLDGSNFGMFYPSTESCGIFVPGQFSTAQELASGNDPVSSILYTSSFGAANRFVFSVKMPPATSDSVSGNYPSDDVSGNQGINKMRMKVQIYYSNEDTTYMGI